MSYNLDIIKHIYTINSDCINIFNLVDGIRALCLIYTSCNDAKKKFKIRRTDSVYVFKKQLKAVLRKSLGKKPKLNEHPQKNY